MNLIQHGLNWVLDPADHKTVVPADYLSRMSTLEIDPADSKEFKVSNPDGTTVDYTKGNFLGAGTFGEVYECVRVTPDGTRTNCVVKSIKEAGAIRQAILETIIQIIVCKETEHSSYPEYDLVGPFAPRVFDIAYDKSTNKCYVFSERMRKTVRDLVNGFKMAPDKTFELLPHTLIRIAVVLSELYKKLEFNHRDFKTDNCMYIRDGKDNFMPRIIDFGFSCIVYKGLEIRAKGGFRYCSIDSRDMSQFIYELFRYSPWLPDPLKEVGHALLTQKRGSTVCDVLKGNCKVGSWRNTYDFYNTKSKANPNGHPLVVRKVLEAFRNGDDWRKKLAYPNATAVATATAVPAARACLGCGVKNKDKNCACLAVDEWVNPPGIPCPALKPDYNPLTKRCVKKCPDGKYRNKAFKCLTRKAVSPKKPAIVPIVPIVASCMPGKERNPKTGRCVKKCVAGQIRDPATGKCVGAVAGPKPCPASKELNPRTGRCVNKCPPGTMRDSRFRCVKPTGSRKAAVAAARANGKICPPGKPDYNPKTKRCVKSCPSGKKRDPWTFKCVSNK